MQRLTDKQLRVLRVLAKKELGKLKWHSGTAVRWCAGMGVKTKDLRRMVELGLIRTKDKKECYWKKKKIPYYIVTKKGLKMREAIDQPLRVLVALDKVMAIIKEGESDGKKVHRRR